MLWIIRFITIFSLAFALTLWYTIEKIVHPRRPNQRPRPDGLGEFEDVVITTADRVCLRGWFVSVPQAKGTILYCPGRGEGLNAFDFRYLHMFTHAGYDVLACDFRGLGASGGMASLGLCEGRDVQAMVGWLRERQAPRPWGAYGTSQGAAVLFLVGGELPDLQAIGGECAFAWQHEIFAQFLRQVYSVPGGLAHGLALMVAKALRWRVGCTQEADPVRTIGRIAPRPVFIIHGARDVLVPVDHARALYEAAGEPKELWIIDEAGHTEGLTLLGEAFARRVVDFFERSLHP
jgi:fermentation-respiration switch protein FrsA (DUF1100 family)